MASRGQNRILHGDPLRAVVKPLLEEFGASDRNRVAQILDLAGGEKIRLADCFPVLFPDLEPAKAVKALTNLRSRFNQVADERGVELRFVVDSHKRDAPTERFCWFVGADPAFAQAEKYSEETTADLGKNLVPSRAILTDLVKNQIVIRVFVSYAHDDRKHADALLEELRRQFKPSRYRLELWIDQEIMSGEKWHEKIQQAIKGCDFGLFLLSPAFFGSEYIRDHELPHFLGEGKKPAFLLGLCRFDLETQDPYRLREHQIYRFHDRFYGSLRKTSEKTDYVHEFFLQAQKRLGEWFALSGTAAAAAVPGRPAQDRAGPEPEAIDSPHPFRVPEETLDFVRPRGIATTLAGLATLDGKAPSRDQARDALEELEAWATAPDAPSFFALLGEYGIGKTTTLKQFTRHLLEKLKGPRAARNALPLPIFVDLRDYVGEREDHVPTIEELLDEVIRRTWKLSERTVAAKDLLRLVREEGALILFDGLDEKLVHLTPVKARAFIRTLWAVLPDAARGQAKAAAPAGTRRGKMILSCRSHYFRDVLSQNAMLIGEDREGLDARSYPALCLLPFSEGQIREYLESCLGSPERARAAIDLIARIHNLPELAQRPYLLSLIAAQLDQLESLSLRGETVNAARLYDLFVRSWLNRDDGKHQLDPVHKRRLMEDLAAALWREGTKQWDGERLEHWLDEFLDAADNRALAGAYQGRNRIVLKEDLRTATFVLRPDTEERHFRFAHTSLQEFFLAGYLARALRERASRRWELPMPSLETLEFLGQILAWERSAADREALSALLGGDGLRAATIAFRYWLLALEKDLPAPQPVHVRLAGADLEEWQVRGPSPERPLGLRGANLAGAWLNRARLENVDLSNADLTGLEARQALFLRVNAPGAQAARADFAGLQWRGGSLARSDLTAAHLAGCQWINTDLGDAILSEDWTRQACTVDVEHPRPARADATLQILDGHVGSVTTCAWSPDGARLASGGQDGTARVWDAASGRGLLALRGHEGWVETCAWSPDGARLASGGTDGTVRVWDAASGRGLLALRGHELGVRSCAWSPDGARLASGGNDGTVRVWDAAGGQCLLTLKGHENVVLACAWSPDGARLASGSFDRTARVWDAASGRWLLSLQGHEGEVRSCAWSPDGARLASAADDRTVRVWDASGCRCLLTLRGHEREVLSCAWSPDGTRLASGGQDGTVRVWDAASGACLWTGHLFRELQFASIDAVTGQVTYASPEAWRFLGWRWFDPELGSHRLLPAETFGPLPS
jgi:uncharacterized protein YjbI with pentapeptide repeats